MAEPMMPNEARKLLEYLTEHPEHIVFELLLRTGIRTHELLTSELRNHELRVRAVKGSRDHTIPLDPAFYNRLYASWQGVQADQPLLS